MIDIEVDNRTPSPTVDPSVHVVLCGHSMGGIVAAETLLSIAKDEPVLSSAVDDNITANSTYSGSQQHSNLDNNDSSATTSSTPVSDSSRLFFPFVQSIVAFDTPYLGISPGVLAHGAEEHINHASSAYKAFESATSFFGRGSASRSPSPIPGAASKGLPAPSGSSGGWSKWGKYAAFGGAAAALAGAAGAAYLSRDQISQGFAWAGSHLEFVGCLARGADLQKRVENVVQLSKSHNIGFANFYTALGEKVTSQTKYAGAMLGSDRTFCVVPKGAQQADSPTGTKRDAPRSSTPYQRPAKSQKPPSSSSALDDEMRNGEQVRQFADDASKSKGRWVKCVNEAVGDEIKAHGSMFSPKTNLNYHSMRDAVRDEILDWVDDAWYQASTDGGHEGQQRADTASGDQEPLESSSPP